MEIEKLNYDIIEMVDEFKIRKGKFKDIPEVIEINMKTLPEHYSDDFYEDMVKSSPETFLVAENKDIVGYIICRIEHGFSSFKKLKIVKKGHIVSVAIKETHRRKGIGKALINNALQGMMMRNCAEAFLEVRISNVMAIELYKVLGFEIKSRMERYYNDGEIAYSMSLNLEEMK